MHEQLGTVHGDSSRRDSATPDLQLAELSMAMRGQSASDGVAGKRWKSLPKHWKPKEMKSKAPE